MTITKIFLIKILAINALLLQLFLLLKIIFPYFLFQKTTDDQENHFSLRLKANFKTQHSVIFVNYDEIKEKIKNQILSLRTEGYQGQISFYASNYSDIQGIDMLTEFNQTFIPFFEQFD